MGNLRQKFNDRILERLETGEHSYRNRYPLSINKVLVAYPSIHGTSDFPVLLARIVKKLPKEWRMDDLALLNDLYKDASANTGWSYRPLPDPLWKNGNMALLSLEPEVDCGDNYLLYELNTELYKIEYEDPVFGLRQFVGQLIESNTEERYLVLDSRGNRRRLNFSKIKGINTYGGKFSKVEGEMKYALFTFETTSESERKVSWEIIPDDRSKTLLKAIGFSPMASIENSKDNFQVVEDSQVNHINSPLPNWVDLLEKKVSVRILEDAHFMDYCFVLDHISWDPKSNMAEVGSKGLTLKAPPGNLTVKLL